MAAVFGENFASAGLIGVFDLCVGVLFLAYGNNLLAQYFLGELLLSVFWP